MYIVEKKIKKTNYCINCNKYGHVQKKCELPTISNGIISIYINNFDEINKKKLDIYISENIGKIDIVNEINNIKLDEINENIKILMIQRKHSLGYIEFIRGRYNEKKLNNDNAYCNNFYPSINYLIEQMNEDEITNINTKNFDELWINLWNNNNNKYFNEYTSSKHKFDEIKLNFNALEFAQSKYFFNEWGFPKGRRNQYETDLVCALREFEEETNINENKIYMFDNCDHIRETMVGTNGITYIHNYFLALLNDDKIIVHKNNEIGDIKIMNIRECINVIRPYHLEKIKIIKIVYCLINNFLNNNL